MSITFLHPAFLILLVLCVAAWVGPWRAKRVPQAVIRTIVFALLAFGLARPVIVRDAAPPTRVWVLDRSQSVRDTSLAGAADRVVELASNAEAGRDVLICFGAELDETTTDHFDEVIHLSQSGPDGQSPLSAALARAAAEIPASCGGSVTIATDGLATHDQDGRAENDLRSRGIPVNVIPLETAEDVRPAALSWTGQMRVGASVPMRVSVTGLAESGTVSIADASGEVASATFGPLKGLIEVPIPFEPQTPGFQELTITVQSADDADPSNNELVQTVAVQEPRRVLYVGDRQQGGARRLGELLGGGFEITEHTGDGSSQLQDQLSRADVVMLDDVAADRVSEVTQQAIAEAVTNDGLGMVMAGGRSSFGSGGWHDTPIEDLLPVEFVQKEEKRDPSTTLVVIIDTSGSMSGQRVQLAKEVTRLAIRRLMPHDKVGIVEFYGAKRWAAPIQPASNAIEIERALNRLDAGGGTVILPAIEEAFYGMQNINTRYKHVLVLTDGGVESGAFEPLLRRMADEGVNVTTVLVGGGIHSEFLVNLANWGKGRFYSVPDRFNLPEIIFKQPSSAKLPSYREGVYNVRARGGSGWWGQVDPTNIPALAGYVETRAKPSAAVLLETERGAHPIVASWRYGLGRVTTFASEPTGAGTEPWNDWNDYGRALARMLDRTASDGRDAFRFTVEPDGRELVVMAQRIVPETPGLEPRVELLIDNGEPTDVVLQQRSPDRWVSRLIAPEAGQAMRFACSDTRGGDTQTLVVGSSSTVDEMHVDPVGRLDLSEVARATGGAVVLLDEPSSGINASDHAGLRVRSLAPISLALALLAFLGELIWRRLP